MPAGADRLGARLPGAARCVPGRALSSRHWPDRFRPNRGARAGAFERWQKNRSRCSGRRRRPALHGAPAVPARGCTALCRLRGVAGAVARARHPAADPPRTVRVDDVLPAARRAVSGLSRRRAPPPPIPRERIAPMRAAAERLLAPQFRDIVRLIDEPILQPIYDLESPRLAFGRVAIIGDAAFVARPHVAAGVAKAANDAASLAQVLGEDMDVA